MTGIFKANNPSNNLLLVLYALVLKAGLFTHAHQVIVITDGSFLYKRIVYLLDGMQAALPWWYAFTIIVLQILQALHINSITNRLRLFPKPNYLVGMSYLLITSLVPGWMMFSPHLLTAGIIIWSFGKMPMLYNESSPKSIIFNLGLATGLCFLIDPPAVVFVLLLLFGVSTFRSFRPNEWLLILLGLLTPLYFYFSFLYLGNYSLKQLPLLKFLLPFQSLNTLKWVIIVLLSLHVLAGIISVNNNLGKQVVQIRNTWKLAIFYLVISSTLFFLGTYYKWVQPIFIVAPVALFMAAFYFYLKKGSVATLLHLILFCIALYIGWWL